MQAFMMVSCFIELLFEYFADSFLKFHHDFVHYITTLSQTTLPTNVLYYKQI